MEVSVILRLEDVYDSVSQNFITFDRSLNSLTLAIFVFVSSTKNVGFKTAELKYNISVNT